MDKRLLIVQLSHYHSKSDRRVFKTRSRQLLPLALPYLAAFTPPDWHVKLVDEQVQDIDFDYPADVVAITSWTVHSSKCKFNQIPWGPRLRCSAGQTLGPFHSVRATET